MTSRLISILVATLATATLIGSVLVGERPVWAAGTSAPSQSDPLQFARGAKAWADNCTRCHNMRNPNELRDDQWRAAMAHMRVRAGLTGEETRDVLAFLQGSN